MCAQTEKMTFLSKVDCTLKKHTWCWTYSTFDIFFSSYFSFDASPKKEDQNCIVHAILTMAVIEVMPPGIYCNYCSCNTQLCVPR